MKKLIMTCALLSSISLVSFAQNAQPAQTTATMQAAPSKAVARPIPTPEEQAQRHAQGEQRQLNLTAEQYKVVYAAELELSKKVEEIKASGHPTPDQFRAANEAKQAKIKAVLTQDQAQKYELMNNRQHRPIAPGTAPMAPTSQPMSK